jgi:ABC-type transport system substrate-binding protein
MRCYHPPVASVRVGLLAPIHGLDPETAQDYASAQVIEQLYDAPFVLDRTHRPQPLLFEAPLARSGPPGGEVQLVGTLRSDARFSDGTFVTAEAVVASLRRIPAITARARIDGSGRHVRFVLAEADPRFEARLSLRWASIVKRVGATLVGTGSFVVRPGWTPERVVIDRNPHALRRPWIEEVEFRVYPPTADGRPEALARAVADGEIDLTTVLSREDMAALKGVRKDFQPGTSTAFLAFNVEHPTLAQVEVRRALCEAIDRTEVTRLSHENPHPFTARSLLPSSMWGGSDGVRHDPARARERLAACGVRFEQPLRMLTIWGPRPYLSAPRRTAQLVQQQLGEVGVPVEIVASTSTADYFSRANAGAYDMVLAGWIADTPDPLDFLDAVLGSQSIPTPTRAVAYASNLSRHRSAELDAALEGYRRDATDTSLQRLMELVTRQAPLAPLCYGPHIVVHGWHLRSVELTASGMPRLALVELDQP